MSAFDEIDSGMKRMRVPKQCVALTYSPQDGLFAWWCETGHSSWEYENAEFVLMKMVLDQGRWWFGKGGDDTEHLNYDCNAIDCDEVDLGPYAWSKTYDEFKAFYDGLQKPAVAEVNKILMNIANQNRIVSAVGVARQMMQQYAPNPVKQVEQVDPDYVVTYKVNGNEFKTMGDVHKYIAYDKLDKIAVSGTASLVNNKDEVIRLLGQL